MRKGTAVIGANFGDEGKGAVVDFLAARSTDLPLVVRFNGGAQAGHTVELEDGRRHVFHHFGAGTLAGAPTFLSQFFIVNPIMFVAEYAELKAKCKAPLHVFTDSECIVTTHYDMILNQAIEQSRGNARHGSCGVGINETITRSRYPQFCITAADLVDSKGLSRRKLFDKLRDIRRHYVPTRLAQYKIDDHELLDDKLYQQHDDMDDAFVASAMQYRDSSPIIERDSSLRKSNAPVIFEGAQGLLLDENSGFFPHVTRSRTGMDNINILANLFGLTELDVVYVTRSYMTRHGAGPFPTEDPNMCFDDETNVPHDFQGTLRFGRLEPREFASRIQGDFKKWKGEFKATKTVAVTHLDQGDPAEVTKLLAQIIGTCKADSMITATGPTRQDYGLTEHVMEEA